MALELVQADSVLYFSITHNLGDGYMKTSNLIQMAMTGTIAIAALGLVVAGNVQAAQCSLVPSGTANMQDSENADLLRTNKFPQLDAVLEKQHRKYMAALGGDLLSFRNISNMLSMTGQDKNLVRMWADERPQSFFAQLTAGIFYNDRAGYDRGTRSIGKTSSSQLGKMNESDQKAISYLQKAIQINPRSALPQAIMIDIAGMEGQAAGKSAEQWLQEANRVDPKNLAARLQAVKYLSPRWGGSFEKVDQLVQQAEKSLPPEAAYYLRFNAVIEKASHEEVITGDKTRAHALYKQAREMCENSERAQQAFNRTYE